MNGRNGTPADPDALTADERFIEQMMSTAAGEPTTDPAALVRAGFAAGRSMAGQRRRRTAISAALAVAVVAAGSAFAVHAAGFSTRGTTPSSTTPTRPTPGRPTTPTDAILRELNSSGAGVGWVVFAGSHAAVAGWDVATPGPLMHAWTRTDDGWRTTRAVHVRNGPTGAEAQNGDAVLIYAGRVDLLHADGRMTPIRISDHSAPARPGEALFGRGSGGDDLWAYDPATNTAAPVPDIPGVETRIAAGWDASGRLWVEGWDGEQGDSAVFVAWSGDGGATWHTHLVSGGDSYPGGLAVDRDGQVAAFAWAGAHERTIRSTSVVTMDGGRTWRPFDRGSGPQWVDSEGYPGGPGAVTQLPDGQIFVVDSGTHALWTASGSWHAFHRVPTPGGVSSVQTNGRLLWAIGAREHKDVFVSADAGATWRTVSPR